MARKILPPVRLLRKLFAYDPVTGELCHKARPRSMFRNQRTFLAWNKRYAGKVTGTPSPAYLIVRVRGETFCVHRVAFKIHYGSEPPELDHINRNQTDNRLINIRVATRSQNMMNRAVRNDSRTGIRGVSLRGASRYLARICVEGYSYYLGYFATAAEAKTAREAAEARLHGEFAAQLSDTERP